MKVPNGTSIYLQFGRKIKIPVNPSDISIKRPSNNKTYEVLDKGEIVVPMPAGLTEVSFESFIPSDSSAPYANSSISPKAFVKALENAKKNKTKGRLIISRSGLFDTNLRCIVEEFETKDKGGEPNDIYYSISLKEYRAYAPQTITIAQPVVPNASQQTQTQQTAQVIASIPRPVETPTLRVGASVIANGVYCYDSGGGKPHGHANNLNTTVKRIVNGRPYPILIGSYGWITAAQLQVTG